MPAINLWSGKGQADFFVKQDDKVGVDAGSNDYAPVAWPTRVNNVPEYVDYTNVGWTLGLWAGSCKCSLTV